MIATAIDVKNHDGSAMRAASRPRDSSASVSADAAWSAVGVPLIFSMLESVTRTFHFGKQGALGERSVRRDGTDARTPYTRGEEDG